MTAISYKYHHFPPSVIQHAVWLYCRFTLSRRDVEELLAERGIEVPDGHDADAFRRLMLSNFNMSLGNGLSKLQGKVFRIGHLGNFNDPMLVGTLAGVEMGLEFAGVPYRSGGTQAAIDYLQSAHARRERP